MMGDSLAAIRERHLPLTRTRDDGSEQPCCHECDTYFKACDAQRALAAYDAIAVRLATVEQALSNLAYWADFMAQESGKHVCDAEIQRARELVRIAPGAVEATDGA